MLGKMSCHLFCSGKVIESTAFQGKKSHHCHQTEHNISSQSCFFFQPFSPFWGRWKVMVRRKNIVAELWEIHRWPPQILLSVRFGNHKVRVQNELITRGTTCRATGKHQARCEPSAQGQREKYKTVRQLAGKFPLDVHFSTFHFPKTGGLAIASFIYAPLSFWLHEKKACSCH